MKFPKHFLRDGLRMMREPPFGHETSAADEENGSERGGQNALCYSVAHLSDASVIE